MGVQVRHLRLDDNVAEDRQDLVCVQQPLLFGQLIIGVELLDRLTDALGTVQNRFHLI